jgi:hypothetical protein
MVDLEKTYKRNENFVFRKIGDEMILVPIKDNVGDMGYIYNLNELAAFVWENLDGKDLLLDIKNSIVEEFEVSAQQAEEDLCEFVDELKGTGAIIEMKHGA